jgi:cobalt/nickel transport system permease protein
VGANHPHAEFIAGASRVHAAAPLAKVVAMLVFVAAVVATPRVPAWPYAVYGIVAFVGMVAARVPLRFFARRLRILLPFLVAASALPFVARGPRIDVLGVVALSRPGLVALWGIVAKATLGVVASALLVATTEPSDILAALDRLRVPSVLTAIAAFMLRYGQVLRDEAERLQIARVSRGDDPRWFWQARAIARTAGTLFVRGYERGERVHLAMQARGYTGRMPRTAAIVVPVEDWIICLWAPALAACTAIVAWAAV